jgi:hypothetical protein
VFVFVVNSRCLFHIQLMIMVDLFARWFVIWICVFFFNPLTNNCCQLNVRIHETQVFPVNEKYSWQFETVEEKADLFQRVERLKGLVLSNTNNRTHSVAIFDGIFYETLSIFYIKSHFLRRIQSGLFISTWDKPNIFPLTH